MIQNLPNDIKMNVCKYLIGSPTNIKLNNNKALKQIQNKYRIYKTKSESHNEINEDIITFTIEGYNLNFDILYKYKDEIMNIIKNYDYAYLFLCGKYTYDTWTGKDLLPISFERSEYKNNDLTKGSNYDETVFGLKYLYDYEMNEPEKNRIKYPNLNIPNRKYYVKKIIINLKLRNKTNFIKRFYYGLKYILNIEKYDVIL